MIKFDIKGLQDLEDTINGLLYHGGYRRLRVDVETAELNKKLEMERKQKQMEREAKERNKMRKEEEKKKKVEERKKREEAMRERMRRREERKEERKDMTELERRIERHAGLERAGRGFMDYLNYGENVRTAEIHLMNPDPDVNIISQGQRVLLSSHSMKVY